MSASQTLNKKIFVLLLPLAGHLNPATGIIRKLTAQPGLQVTFYGVAEFKAMIEKTGATYAEYSAKLHKEENITENHNPIIKMISDVLKFSEATIDQILAHVEQAKPDLIIYDLFSLHAKYLLKILHKRHSQSGSGIY